MWGVRWLTNGNSSSQTADVKPLRAAAVNGDGGSAEASPPETSTGTAGATEAGRANGHAPAQHGGAEGSHVPPGAALLPAICKTA